MRAMLRPCSHRAALLLPLFLAATACRHAAPEPRSAVAPADPNADVPLEIDNHNWLDVIIYVVRDGQASRVGIANASSSASFSLPVRMLGQGREIRLWGHPIGGTGAILMAKLLAGLDSVGGQFGLQVMCAGHGMATATIVERV